MELNVICKVTGAIKFPCFSKRKPRKIASENKDTSKGILDSPWEKEKWHKVKSIEERKRAQGNLNFFLR